MKHVMKNADPERSNEIARAVIEALSAHGGDMTVATCLLGLSAGVSAWMMTAGCALLSRQPQGVAIEDVLLALMTGLTGALECHLATLIENPPSDLAGHMALAAARPTGPLN